MLASAEMEFPAPNVQQRFTKAAYEVIRCVRRQHTADIVKRSVHQRGKVVGRRMLRPTPSRFQAGLALAFRVHPHTENWGPGVASGLRRAARSADILGVSRDRRARDASKAQPWRGAKCSLCQSSLVSKSELTFRSDRHAGLLPIGPQPVKPDKPKLKTSWPGWLGGWI
jgi:hypothetical protein